MNDLNLDKYLDITNKEKVKRGLDTYIPLYPMLRIDNNKLYVGVLLTKEEDDVWNVEGNVKPNHWVLIDIEEEKIKEFNKTDEKDFASGELSPKNIDNKQKEISKYKVEKTLQYRNYLMEDIKNEQLPIQKNLSKILGNEMYIGDEKVNINEYLISNLEESIKEKTKELVDILIYSKFGSITFYYDMLLNEIINQYKETKYIDKDKMKLCIEIMNYYYDGVIGIEEFFNI